MPVEIKICGLKTPEAMAAALDAGASHVGFIFFPRSPRHVSLDEAGRLREAARGRAKAVAVTVDATDVALDEIVAAVAPDMLQLHGEETPERVDAVRTRWSLPVVKALSVRERGDVERARAYRGVADFLLFDAKPPTGAVLPGGNGVSFDWRVLAGLDAPFFLSGGLHAGNVAEALGVARPAGLDVSSGVESGPGVKDAGLIAGFFRAVRAAEAAALAA